MALMDLFEEFPRFNSIDGIFLGFLSRLSPLDLLLLSDLYRFPALRLFKLGRGSIPF
jgi:hypothetical protein